MPVDVRLTGGRIDVIPDLLLLILGRQTDDAKHDALPGPSPGSSDQDRASARGAEPPGHRRVQPPFAISRQREAGPNIFTAQIGKIADYTRPPFRPGPRVMTLSAAHHVPELSP